jgi:hypothetical protein
LPVVVIACDKREAFAQGALATQQSSFLAGPRNKLDCFAEFIIGHASRDPLARNDG